MKHYGDITKINGACVPAVDIIVGGSPCQDLSVAGQRAGLSGERSGLFMEQIRVIKEMREHDKSTGRTDVDIRPRYMVWENVPGAFSSNGGEDFRTVLEETARICDKDAVIPRPGVGGWTPSGAIMGDGWSIAWRVHDAQFWGVPQRRKRISLVADFGGLSAPEILFERKGLRGNFEESETKRERTSETTGESIKRTINNRSTEKKQTLIESHPQDSRMKEVDICQALTGRMGTGGGNVPLVLEEPIYSIDEAVGQTYIWEDISNTLKARDYKQPQAVCVGNGQVDQLRESETVGALNCMHDQQAVIHNSIIRRLTPMECERLQGYPDGWTDIGEWTDSKGKKHQSADSLRYKALGNSIALPFWEWMAQRIVNTYDRPVEMASLFDGIGGFPLVFQRCGCKPVWASEIEEFPMAVTKVRFGEEE